MSSAVLVAAGVVIAAFVVLALLRPRVSLITLVALDVSNLNGVIAEHVGTSPYRPQLALAVLVLVLLACRRQLRWSWSPVLLGLMVLFAGFCLSFVHAADPVASEQLLAERLRDLFYFVIVFALLLSTRSLENVVRVTVLVLAALAGLTAVHEFVLHNAGDLFGLSRVPLVQEGGASTARHAGTSSDVNFWARLLILFTPLALSLLAASRTAWSRFVWAGCALSLLLGVYLTQSRGGFIALFLALICWLALAGGWYRKAILLLPLALVVIVPVSGIGSRLMTLVTSVGGSSGADPSVLERERLQLDAWHMFLDRPAFGHGIGSYRTLFPSYDRTSNAYQPVDIVVAAHNFYLEQAADGGVVLLLAWLVLAGTVLFAALRAAGICRAPGQQASRLLAVGMVAGVLGWAVASIFLHLSDFRALLLIAALAAALDIRAGRLAIPLPVPTVAARHQLPAAIPALLAAVLVAVTGVAAAVLLHPVGYTSATTLAVVPSASAVDGSNAYQVDVISRGVIVPTLTQVLDRSVTETEVFEAAGTEPMANVSVSVAQSRLGGSIVVAVTAPSRRLAVELGARAVNLSTAKVASLNSSYALNGDASHVAANRDLGPWTALPLAPAVVIGLLIWFGVSRSRNSRPRRARGADESTLVGAG